MSGEEHLGIREVVRIPEIRAAMLGTFVIMLGFGILAPVLPNYARSFEVGYDAVGLLISAFSFARLISDPFVGRFIDRYGERAMSTWGAVWVGLSSIAAGLAPTFPLLVLFRALGGVGSALFFAALLSFLLRSIPAERTGRVMGVYYAAFNVGFIAGVVRAREPAVRLCGRVSDRGGRVLEDAPRPGASRVGDAPQRDPAPAVEPPVHHRAGRERGLPVDHRGGLPDAGSALRDEHIYRNEHRRRRVRPRRRDGDRARRALSRR
ncbi:MAG: MFS transporter [Actinobacteria bacterium]|nr:MAG: MFS transporter [Actinomycetota bacterium]